MTWWYIHDLWLKFSVNILYTFGFLGDFDWQLYINLVIGASVSLYEYYRPFVTNVDNRTFVLTMLSLATVSHLSAGFKVGTRWPVGSICIALVLFCVPLFATVSGHFWYYWRNIRNRATAKMRWKLDTGFKRALTVRKLGKITQSVLPPQRGQLYEDSRGAWCNDDDTLRQDAPIRRSQFTDVVELEEAGPPGAVTGGP